MCQPINLQCHSLQIQQTGHGCLRDRDITQILTMNPRRFLISVAFRFGTVNSPATSWCSHNIATPHFLNNCTNEGGSWRRAGAKGSHSARIHVPSLQCRIHRSVGSVLESVAVLVLHGFRGELVLTGARRVLGLVSVACVQRSQVLQCTEGTT